MKKQFIYTLLMLLLCGNICISAKTPSIANTTQISVVQKAAPKYIQVKPLDVVAYPQAYLNQNIEMQAIFDKFSTLGLDYSPALKKSEDYIGILIRRDDITDHVMPLSEMKLFLKRTTAEKFIDLESGDKIKIQGKVFSAAMSDPWIEITELTVISSKKPIKAN